MTGITENNLKEEGHREGERTTIPGRRDQPCPWTLVSLSTMTFDHATGDTCRASVSARA